MSKRKRDTDLPECSKAVQEATPMDTSIGRHEVFISHRGIEMKRKFANHLYEALKQRGITAFLDLKELPEGGDVRDFMPEAARRAIIQVPFFTRIYPESPWCLDELVEMIKSTKSPSNAKVIPVFYDVKPEALRLKDGPFAEAFKAHLEKRQYDENRVRQWKDALYEASWLNGFRLETYNQREGELLKDLVAKIVHEIQDRVAVDVVPHAVGLEERVEDVVKLFRLEEKTTVYFYLLWGMGGIGKTTLARAIYHRHRKELDAASFVGNCGDLKTSGIQDCLRKDLLQDESVVGDDVGRGRALLKHGLTHKKVLIVFDDLKSFASIEEVLDPRSLNPGSRILVTSRDGKVFPDKDDPVFQSELYELQPMVEQESLRLFCHHAFKKPSPEPGFEELALTVAKACGGLPLSLEVLGRHLRGVKKEKLWQEAISKLRSDNYKGIFGTLMISYDALEDDEKEMFLDVACFLIGEEKRSAKYFWDGLGWGGSSGLKRLIELCLVKVNVEKREQHFLRWSRERKLLTMHDQLRDMGRSIVEKEFRRTGKWSRLWSDEVTLRVLQTNQGLDQIRGLATSLPKLSAGLLSQMRSLRLLSLNGTDLGGECKGLQGLEMAVLPL